MDVILKEKPNILLSEKRHLPALNRANLAFVIMGLFFIAMAVFEYMYPEGKGSARTAIKILCGVQIAFATIVIFFSQKYCARTRWVPMAFFLLWLWLSLSGIIQTVSLKETLYTCIIYSYWYTLFVFFYRSARKDQLGLQRFLILVVCSLLIWLLALKHSSSIIMKVRYNRPVDFLQQNYIGYYIIALFPYVLMLKKTSLKIISIVLISYGAMYSLKRGAVLALMLMGIGSSFLYVTFVSNKNKNVKKMAVIILLWGVILLVGGAFFYANREAVLDRLSEGTNREGIFTRAKNTLMADSEIYELVIGHGDRQAQRLLGFFTHNDWLMLIYDYGMIGVLLMINIYLSIIGLIWKLCKLRSPLLMPLFSAFILMVCVQQYSIGLQLKTFGFIAGSIGLVAGKYYGIKRVDCNFKIISRI